MRLRKKLVLFMTIVMTIFFMNSTVWANIKSDSYHDKIYTVKFFTADGKKEYTNLRKKIRYGKNIKLPSVSSDKSHKFVGWTSKKGSGVEKKINSTVKVKNNIKYYVVFQKISVIRLCKNNGELWKTISNASNTVTFPAVGKTTNSMYLGWSRTKGRHTLSSSDYKAGDIIPKKNGKYYMVEFLSSMDIAPSIIRQPTKYSKVFFVGDSRTVGMQNALGANCPKSVNFVAECGKGLNWFKETGYEQLMKYIISCDPAEKKAVIFNLGVNDLNNNIYYIYYMKEIESILKKYNCTLFYMSVNPVNSDMIRRANGRIRTERSVADFNYSIRTNLCSGKDASFTFIDSCSYLQKKGWISRRKSSGIYDGLHYSTNTYLRIYNYCINSINK